MDYLIDWYTNGASWTDSVTTNFLSGDTINSNLLTIGDIIGCSITATDFTDNTSSGIEESTIVSCPVQYEYDIVSNFSDLQNIQECWSTGYNAPPYSDSFIPLSFYSTSASSYYEHLGSHSTSIPNTSNSHSGLLVSIQDGSHISQETLSVKTGNTRYNILHNPEVLKFNVSDSEYFYLRWQAPISAECTIQFDLLPASWKSLTGHAINELENNVQLYHNDVSVESYFVEGYNENLVGIDHTITMEAGDTISIVAEPSSITSRNNVDWIQITGAITCPY